MKKSLLITLFAFLTLSGFSQQGVWLSQATGFNPTSSGIRNISVVDTNTVWLSPYDGSGGGNPRQDFSMTKNGGTNWMAGTIPTTTSWDWGMIDGLDSNKAWGIFFSAVTLNLGQIWHTSNGGMNWTQQGTNIYNTAGESFPNVIHFFNDTDGVIVGDPISTGGNHFEIYTTTNGGTNWVAVPSANIPAPLNANEAGWTVHMDSRGDTVWFDTNQGRVYRSVDKGYNWTVSNTNLINFSGTIDVCFYNELRGIARYYNDTTTSNSIVETNDGGLTWSTSFNPIGNFFGADVKAVPGVDSMMVSTGVSTVSAFIGSSYSTDGGHNWVTLETDAQRNALGIADSLTMWTGGFTTSPASDGIFKWIIINPVSCADTNVNSGITLASDTAICHNDTAFFSTSGIFSPVNGDFSGFAVALSSGDISGSSDPNNEASYIGSYPFVFPPPTDFNNFIVNDGALIDGVALPFGVYYFTPVVFGNATAAATPTTRLFDLNLDPNCTFTGTSVAVNIQDWGIPPCSPVGIKELYNNHITLNSSIRNAQTLDVLINSTEFAKVNIQVLDLTGRIVKTVVTSVKEGSNHELINVENLASGTYLIKAEMNGFKASDKVVKY